MRPTRSTHHFMIVVLLYRPVMKLSRTTEMDNLVTTIFISSRRARKNLDCHETEPALSTMRLYNAQAPLLHSTYPIKSYLVYMYKAAV